MKRYLPIVLIFFAAQGLFAQVGVEVGAMDFERFGTDAAAQQRLREVSVDKFERDGFWRSSISSDFGVATSRLFTGGPVGKQPIPEEEGFNIPDENVLGVRVDFLRRGFSSFFVYPVRPIPIEGITQMVSVWVAGRNYDHELYLLIEDFFGRPFELYMGRLNFQGWQRLVVAIPPQTGDAGRGIVQRNFHYSHNIGLNIRGFRVAVSPWQAVGSYYIYFDDLRAVTDLFAIEDRDPDDMSDGW